MVTGAVVRVCVGPVPPTSAGPLVRPGPGEPDQGGVRGAASAVLARGHGGPMTATMAPERPTLSVAKKQLNPQSIVILGFLHLVAPPCRPGALGVALRWFSGLGRPPSRVG